MSCTGLAESLCVAIATSTVPGLPHIAATCPLTPAAVPCGIQELQPGWEMHTSLLVWKCLLGLLPIHIRCSTCWRTAARCQLPAMKQQHLLQACCVLNAPILDTALPKQNSRAVSLMLLDSTVCSSRGQALAVRAYLLQHMRCLFPACMHAKLSVAMPAGDCLRPSMHAIQNNAVPTLPNKVCYKQRWSPIPGFGCSLISRSPHL